MPEPGSPKKVLNTLVDPLPRIRRPEEELTGPYLPALKHRPEINLGEFLAPAQSDGELGRLAHYRVLKVLGHGGMGMVLLAEDVYLKRLAAVKIILPQYAREAQARERFLREAQAAAKIRHDNVVTIFQVGEERGLPFIAMEFLKGSSLESFMDKRGDMTIGQVIRVGRQIAEGLKAAHAQGLTHRDIKPANIWLEAPKGRVKILDFGLASDATGDVKLTHSGVVIGTPLFMSPEQADGQVVDQRSDLFSLGVVLYRLCTGQQPFMAKNMMGVLNALATHTPPPVRQLNPSVPTELERLIERMLVKDPANRIRTTDEVIAVLADLQNPAKRLSIAAPQLLELPADETEPKPIVEELPLDPPADPNAWADFDPIMMEEDTVNNFSATSKVFSTIKTVLKRRPAYWIGAAAIAVLVVGILIASRGRSKHGPAGDTELADANSQQAKNDPKVPGDGQETTKKNDFVKTEVPKTSPIDQTTPPVDPMPAPKKDDPIVKKKSDPAPVDPPKKEGPIAEMKPALLPVDTPKLPDPFLAKPDGPLVVKKDAGRPAPALLTTPFTRNPDVARAEWAKYLDIPERKELDLPNGVKLEMVLIPPGEFQMGSPKAEQDKLVTPPKNEAQHRVIISEPFYMAATETTQAQYEAVMKYNPSFFSAKSAGKNRVPADTSNYPVDKVSWEDAKAFCGKLRVDLPTEAQWEYACRAGTTTAFHVGDSNFYLQANAVASNPFGKTDKGKSLGTTVAVRSYPANAFGLFDMHGNVAEWCSDYYSDSTHDQGQLDPERISPTYANTRTMRGGAWNDSANACRTAARKGVSPKLCGNGDGFRIAQAVQLNQFDRALGRLRVPCGKEQIEKTRSLCAEKWGLLERKELILPKGVKLEMVLVPPGRFRMGTMRNDRNEESHFVSITRPFYFAVTETTQEQYESLMERNPPQSQVAKNPIENVSWDDSQEWIQKLNAHFRGRHQMKVRFRLPSEAEWEYACRAGSTYSFHFGDELTKQKANFDGSAAKPVSSYEANAFGLFDMHGNVAEWCEDYYGQFDKAPINGEPQLARSLGGLGGKRGGPLRLGPPGAAGGSNIKQMDGYRVIRGGGYDNGWVLCQSGARHSDAPNSRSPARGFRVVACPPD